MCKNLLHGLSRLCICHSPSFTSIMHNHPSLLFRYFSVIQHSFYTIHPSIHPIHNILLNFASIKSDLIILFNNLSSSILSLNPNQLNTVLCSTTNHLITPVLFRTSSFLTHYIHITPHILISITFNLFFFAIPYSTLQSHTVQLAQLFLYTTFSFQSFPSPFN